MWNFVDLIFIEFTIIIVFLSFLINLREKFLPTIILQTFRYGKHAYNGAPSQIVSCCEVPKSYFKHFYVFAFVWSLTIFGLATTVYVAHWPVPQWLIRCLDALCGEKRIALSKKTYSLNICINYLFQCFLIFSFTIADIYSRCLAYLTMHKTIL